MTRFKELTEQEQAALYHARERRSSAQDVQSFDADVTSPFDMGTVAATGDLPTPYPSRKDAQLGISFSVPIAVGQLTVDLADGRTMGTPALAADQVHRLGNIRRALELTPSCAIAGTVTIYVFDEWFRPDAIATGVFS